MVSFDLTATTFKIHAYTFNLWEKKVKNLFPSSHSYSGYLRKCQKFMSPEYYFVKLTNRKTQSSEDPPAPQKKNPK